MPGMHHSAKANRRPKANSHGFTIVELLVVIVVIGILATMAIVAYNGFQQKARDAGVKSDVNQISIAEAQYVVINGTGGKDWYSTNGLDASLNFRASPGNIIDVVTNATAYCVRAYNPGAATYTTLATAATYESATGACNIIAASAAAIAASPYPVTAVADNFNRTAGVLGTTSTGGASWNALAGTWSTNGAVATTSSADSANPLAVVDFTHADVDASADISPSGGGDALIIRATDSANYIRARYYHTYSTSTTAGSCSVGSYGSNIYWGPSEAVSPGTSWYNNPGSGNCAGYTSQYEWVSGTNDPSAPVGFRCPCYRVYAQDRPLTSVSGSTIYTYYYYVYIEKVVAGIATTLYSSDVGSSISRLRLTAVGSAISLYVNGSATARTSLTETFNQTATKHGIGRGTPGNYSTSALDNFSLLQP